MADARPPCSGRIEARIEAKENRPGMTGQTLVMVSLLVVALVLLAGLYTLWIGGETSRNWSNRLMRLRVLAQFVAIIIIMSVLYFSSR
jgi:hypothetical protein